MDADLNVMSTTTTDGGMTCKLSFFVFFLRRTVVVRSLLLTVFHTSSQLQADFKSKVSI